MELKELKETIRKFDLGHIKPTSHGFKRTQDQRRGISYPLVVKHLLSLKGLYKFEEQESNFPDYRKFKLWFQLNYDIDLNVYIAIPKVLNTKSNLKIISAHKVKRKLQRTLPNRNMMKK